MPKPLSAQYLSADIYRQTLRESKKYDVTTYDWEAELNEYDKNWPWFHYWDQYTKQEKWLRRGLPEDDSRLKNSMLSPGLVTLLGKTKKAPDPRDWNPSFFGNYDDPVWHKRCCAEIQKQCVPLYEAKLLEVDSVPVKSLLEALNVKIVAKTPLTEKQKIETEIKPIMEAIKAINRVALEKKSFENSAELLSETPHTYSPNSYYYHRAQETFQSTPLWLAVTRSSETKDTEVASYLMNELHTNPHLLKEPEESILDCFVGKGLTLQNAHADHLAHLLKIAEKSHETNLIQCTTREGAQSISFTCLENAVNQKQIEILKLLMPLYLNVSQKFLITPTETKEEKKEEMSENLGAYWRKLFMDIIKGPTGNYYSFDFGFFKEIVGMLSSHPNGKNILNYLKKDIVEALDSRAHLRATNYFLEQLGSPKDTASIDRINNLVKEIQESKERHSYSTLAGWFNDYFLKKPDPSRKDDVFFQGVITRLLESGYDPSDIHSLIPLLDERGYFKEADFILKHTSKVSSHFNTVEKRLSLAIENPTHFSAEQVEKLFAEYADKVDLKKDSWLRLAFESGEESSDFTRSRRRDAPKLIHSLLKLGVSVPIDLIALSIRENKEYAVEMLSRSSVSSYAELDSAKDFESSLINKVIKNSRMDLLKVMLERFPELAQKPVTRFGEEKAEHKTEHKIPEQPDTLITLGAKLALNALANELEVARIQTVYSPSDYISMDLEERMQGFFLLCDAAKIKNTSLRQNYQLLKDLRSYQSSELSPTNPNYVVIDQLYSRFYEDGSPQREKALATFERMVLTQLFQEMQQFLRQNKVEYKWSKEEKEQTLKLYKEQCDKSDAVLLGPNCLKVGEDGSYIDITSINPKHSTKAREAMDEVLLSPSTSSSSSTSLSSTTAAITKTITTPSLDPNLISLIQGLYTGPSCVDTWNALPLLEKSEMMLGFLKKSPDGFGHDLLPYVEMALVTCGVSPKQLHCIQAGPDAVGREYKLHEQIRASLTSAQKDGRQFGPGESKEKLDESSESFVRFGLVMVGSTHAVPALIDFVEKKIYVIDPMGQGSTQTRMEADFKKATEELPELKDFAVVSPSSDCEPQQRNGSDCAVFASMSLFRMVLKKMKVPGLEHLYADIETGQGYQKEQQNRVTDYLGYLLAAAKQVQPDLVNFRESVPEEKEELAPRDQLKLDVARLNLSGKDHHHYALSAIGDYLTNPSHSGALYQDVLNEFKNPEQLKKLCIAMRESKLDIEKHHNYFKLMDTAIRQKQYRYLTDKELLSILTDLKNDYVAENVKDAPKDLASLAEKWKQLDSYITHYVHMDLETKISDKFHKKIAAMLTDGEAKDTKEEKDPTKQVNISEKANAIIGALESHLVTTEDERKDKEIRALFLLEKMTPEMVDAICEEFVAQKNRRFRTPDLAMRWFAGIASFEAGRLESKSKTHTASGTDRSVTKASSSTTRTKKEISELPSLLTKNYFASLKKMIPTVPATVVLGQGGLAPPVQDEGQALDGLAFAGQDEGIAVDGLAPPAQDEGQALDGLAPLPVQEEELGGLPPPAPVEQQQPIGVRWQALLSTAEGIVESRNGLEASSSSSPKI